LEAINIADASHDIIVQYVELRNKFHKQLKSKPVTLEDTVSWMRSARIIAIGLIKNHELLGVAVTYLDRGNEVAFFTKIHQKGLGKAILRNLEEAALSHGLSDLWARTDPGNRPAKSVFESNGWVLVSEDEQVANYKKSLLSQR
jgi:hypothetical protein